MIVQGSQCRPAMLRGRLAVRPVQGARGSLTGFYELPGLEIDMKLDLGGQETLESPTAEDIRHYLKYTPAASPFVVLSSTTGFMQAIYAERNYQVEYRLDDGQRQYYCLADYETACELFLDFHAEKTNYQTSVEWKRLWRWDKPIHPLVLAILCVIGVLVISGFIWLEVMRWL